MKTKLFAMFLAVTAVTLSAQVPPPPGVPAPAPASAAPASAAPASGNTSAPSGSLGQRRQPLYQQRNAAAAAAAAATVATTPVITPPEEMIPPGTIDFTSADVSQVLDIYAKLVNRTVLHGALPEGKIVLKTQTPLTKTEAIQALQAMLALNNISVVNIGDKFVKAVPSDQANTTGAELDRSGSTNLPNLGSYLTHVAQLRYVKPSVMIQFIQPFAKLQSGLLGIDDNGILVMRDYAENIKRMLEMIDQIDISVPTEYISEVIPIRYAKVDEIASALNSLGGSGGGATVSIGQSAGGGQISGFGSRSGGMSSMGGGMGGAGGYQGGGSGIGGGIGGSSGAFGARSTGASGVPNPNGTPSTGSSFAQRLNNIIAKAGGGSGAGGGGSQDQIQLFGQTKIIPNESSSTLLIYATRQDLAQIKEIISKLDVPLAQVLIEAVIMDVTIGNSFNLGLSAAQNPKTLGSGIIGGGGMNNGQSFLNVIQTLTTNYNSSGLIQSISSTVSGSGIGTNGGSGFGSGLPGGFSYFGNIGPNYDVALTAAESDSHASIIQRPRIQTSQAKAAQFFVGETKPYVTSSYGGGGSGYGYGNSYSQLSVGVELDVTPFINPDGEVSMDIQQEIDDFNGTTAIANVGDVPNTIKRTLNTSITVRDRDTVMLGGFIKSDKSTSKSGVPFLMDIPLLGNLFTQRSDSKDRKELIVLMRPTVLKTPALAAHNTIEESQRPPGVSAAAAEDAEYERKLVDAERKRELKAAKDGSNTNGFFNTLLPVEIPASTVPTNAIENTTPPAPAAEADPAAAAMEKSRAEFQQKTSELDAPATSPKLSPAKMKKLDALKNDYLAGKISAAEYKAACEKIAGTAK